jgi:type I restriction enzyme R subunit
VISNGTDSRYFANTTKRDKNSFDFTMNWAKSDNTLIKDLKDFTATFFQKNTLLNVLLRYSVFDVSGTLLVMRPYQTQFMVKSKLFLSRLVVLAK